MFFKKKSIILKIVFSFTLLFFISCGEAKESDQSTENEENAVQVTDHKCSHCGMNSEDHPQWNAVITSQAGEHWFCSPRCMFQVVLDEKNKPKNIGSIQVTDYYETKKIDAKTAFYVTGSDVMGSMGYDLIPFKDEPSAKDFMKEHQGKKIFSFEEINLKIVKEAINPRNN